MVQHGRVPQPVADDARGVRQQRTQHPDRPELQPRRPRPRESVRAHGTHEAAHPRGSVQRLQHRLVHEPEHDGAVRRGRQSDRRIRSGDRRGAGTRDGIRRPAERTEIGGLGHGLDWCELAQLALSAFCTFLRAFSSRRGRRGAPLEEFSSVSDRPIIVRMSSTFRPQQRYDHRLRHLVQRTGDRSIATNPRSRARRRVDGSARRRRAWSLWISRTSRSPNSDRRS